MGRPKNPDAKTTQAVDRAIEILSSFSFEQPARTALELQNSLKLSRGTLYRLLHTLQAHGLVKASGEPQRFSLDLGVVKLANVWSSSLDASDVARPLLESLRQETRETISLFQLEAGQRVCILDLRSPHTLRVDRGLGPTEHIALGASGKVILAFMSKEALATILASLPKKVSAKKLSAELSEIRANGFATTRGEVYEGAAAVSAAYFDQQGVVAGSIAVFSPEGRMDRDRVAKLAPKVIATARQLSKQLGSPGYPPLATARSL